MPNRNCGQEQSPNKECYVRKGKQESEEIDRVRIKVCNIPLVVPEIPSLTPCQKQKREQKIKAGVKFCPKAPVEPPPPPVNCLGICIEKLKNPPITPKPNEIQVCVVEREKTNQDRCEAIRLVEEGHEDALLPRCPLPPFPAHQKLGPCEELCRKVQREDCLKRMKRFTQ